MSQPIKIEVNGRTATAAGPFPMDFLRIAARLSGRKRWTGSRAVDFEFTAANKRILDAAGLDIAWQDNSGDLAAVEAMAAMPTQLAGGEPRLGRYEPALPLFAHQRTALALSQDRDNYAYLLEMGLGKTAIAIANAGTLWAEGRVDALLVIAPKGVHRQWVNEELPAHADKRMPLRCWAWGGVVPQIDFWQGEALNVLAMNVDAVRTERGYQAAHDFLTRFEGRVMMVVDESHTIKNASARRTKLTIALGRLARYRRIMTGTPIAKNLIDAWAQFLFLDERILGHRYVTSFRARYCVMGGFEGRQVIGQKNVEEFYALIAPHAYRLTKTEALDLPPKVYVQREYDMAAKTARHYKELKNTFMTELDNGELVDVATAATAVLRLQQVVCGYLPSDAGTEEIGHERLDELMEIVRQTSGPTVVWARFKADIVRLRAALSEEFGEDAVVTYYGDTPTAERTRAVERFKAGEARFLVSNPAAGGTGLNLQGACQTVIYYSNSFDALHRWQSEDRTHRMGMRGTVTYYDLVANKSVDRIILRNLKAKKSMSDLTLDDIRQALKE